MVDLFPYIGFGEILVLLFVFSLIPVIILMIPMWRIFARTGMGGALSLLMLIPLVNLVMLYVLAFSDWPIERELQQLRAQLSPQQRPWS